MDPRTVGVEEELFLVDPQTREVSPRSQRALDTVAADHSRSGTDDLDHELFVHQLETRTPPVTDAGELREHLLHGRRRAAEAAGRADLVTIASGTVPLESDTLPRVTREDRYLDMLQRYGEIAHPGGICGLHVHVHVASDEEGVGVIDRIGPWLPVLLAISANSPFYQSRDTAHASWRSQLWAQWPTAGPTGRFGSIERYREVGRRLITSGAARDPGMLYFDARLSAEHPTVEVRVSDVCTDVDDGVLIAVVLRALVMHAADHAQEREQEQAEWPVELLRAAKWRAARYGLADRLVDPTTGEPAPARSVLEGLVGLVREELEAYGDLALVQDAVPRVLAAGGAVRQRAAYERTGGSFTAVVDDLIERTNVG